LEIWKIGQILWIDAITFIIAVIFVKKARGFLTFIMVATAMNFLLTPVSTLAPYFVKFDHFGGASDLAFVLASFQGGVLAGGLLMLVIKGFKRKMVAVVLSVYIIFSGYALMALAPTGLFWFMAMAGLVMAFCIPVANVSIQTITQTVVPKKILGRVSSVTGALASAASPLGMILSGVIVGFTRTANLFLACAVSGILILTLAWFFTDIRHVEEMKEETVETR